MKGVWIDSENRYIAFLDIMGFSNYVLRNKHTFVKKRMLWLKNAIKAAEAEMNGISASYGEDGWIRTVIFSDSILIISKDDSPQNLWYLVSTCQLILSKCFINHVPIKGAISQGMVTANFEESLFFGKALIDAYRLEEELYMYGIILDHKVEKKMQEVEGVLSNKVHQHLVPLKKGRATHYIVNWMERMYVTLWPDADAQKELLGMETVAILQFKEFYLSMSGYPRTYIDNTIHVIEGIFKNLPK